MTLSLWRRVAQTGFWTVACVFAVATQSCNQQVTTLPEMERLSMLKFPPNLSVDQVEFYTDYFSFGPDYTCLLRIEMDQSLYDEMLTLNSIPVAASSEYE